QGDGRAGVQPPEGEGRRRLAPQHERDLVGIRPEAPGEHEEQHPRRCGEGQSQPPLHAAAPGLGAELATAARPGTATRARRDAGQPTMTAPNTKRGMLHQIHDTMGNTQALKLAVPASLSKARRVRYRSSNAAERMAGLPTGSVLRS